MASRDDDDGDGDGFDSLLDGTADDFFKGSGSRGRSAGARAAGAGAGVPDADAPDADADAADEEADFGAADAFAGADAGVPLPEEPPERFPLRRVRPLIREREVEDGNTDAEGNPLGDGDDDGAGGKGDVVNSSGGGASASVDVNAGGAGSSSSTSSSSSSPSPSSVGRNAAVAAACKEEGNRHFAAGALEAAAACYTEALRRSPRGAATAPQRAVFYCNRAACALALQPPRHADCIYDCDRALELEPDYVKALARRGQSLEATGALDEALRDLQSLAALTPRDARATAEVARLQQLTTERDEKLKADMFDKLKGLGNSLLGNFGLSLDNFKAIKDPATGSYSISFTQ